MNEYLTFTGKKIDLVHRKEKYFSLPDIAHSLSLLCMYYRIVFLFYRKNQARKGLISLDKKMLDQSR